MEDCGLGRTLSTSFRKQQWQRLGIWGAWAYPIPDTTGRWDFEKIGYVNKINQKLIQVLKRIFQDSFIFKGDYWGFKIYNK